MWPRMCVCALAVALCLLDGAQKASAASLQNAEQLEAELLELALQQSENEDILRQTRSAANWLNPIVGTVAAGAQAAPAGSTISNILTPAPVLIAGADGTTTALQLVLLVVNAAAPPAQCQPSAAPSPPNVVIPEPSPAPTPAPAPAPSYIPTNPSPIPIQDDSINKEPVNQPQQPTIDKEPKMMTRPQRPQRPRRPGRPTPRPRPVPEPEQPSPSPPAERTTRQTPNFPPVEDSQLLLRQWRAQIVKNAMLPPVITDPPSGGPDDTVVADDENSVSPATTTSSPVSPQTAPYPPSNNNPFFERAEIERCLGVCKQKSRTRYAGGGGGAPDPGNSGNVQSSPALPRFDRSVTLKAILTVPGADYSEPYTVWWDAASGASRIDYHDGTASTYRMMRLDGLVQSIHVRVDRTGETDVRHCVMMTPRRVSLAERALPILPDLSRFIFAGYIDVPPSAGNVPARIERWRYMTTGEGGISREILTYRHELLVARAPDNFTTTPLRYSVGIDSSILGDNSDTYTHRFVRVMTQSHDPSMFHLDVGDACETIDKTDQIDIVEPLREFTMLERNPKHTTAFQQYKKTFMRNYADDIEETVRNSVLMQTSRFVSSGNRQGASFELDTNFLSDRLEVEQSQLLGAVENGGMADGMTFPHTREEVSGLRGRLPRTFDWRMRGAVTSVRYQDTCASCWAFSVVGAVEGALFVNTGRLVPLSEQSLVDCGRPYGVNGCSPSWPSFAYNYVEDQGLPALDEYTPYQAKEQQCRAAEVPAITRISGHVNVTARDPVALKVAIRRHGPTVVLVDAKTTSFIAHKRGYYHDDKCKKNSSNHAMLAVGWTVHRGETYFILKNWWSTGWGENGYINVRAKTNTCGVLRMPSYPVLRNNDVLRIPNSAPTSVTPPST